MVPGQHAPDAYQNLTSNYIFNCSHPIGIRQNWDHGVPLCLGENPGFKHFDLCYSFKTLVCLDYGGFGQLHQAAWNYQNNRVAAFARSEDNRMSYEKALWNLIVFLFAHYIEAFECHCARQGHQAILALECLTVADELGRYHHWYKRADLRKPGIEKTWWKDLPSVPQEDHQSSYASGLAALGSPKQPSYGHLQKLGRYFDHIYHQSQNVGQLTRKSRDQNTGYNETVYTQELREILSYLSGFGNLSHVPRHKKTPASLLNSEIILPEADFQALWGQDSGWIGDESWAEGEQIQPFEHDGLQTRADWVGNPEELKRVNDKVDRKDHEEMYLEDYPDDVPDLEDTYSIEVSVQDWLGATPANTTISTDTEAAGDMLNLSMGTSIAPEFDRQGEPGTGCSDAAPSDDEQFQDMFKAPEKVPECQNRVSSMPPFLDFQALMAEAQFKSGRRQLPPPCYKDDKDTRNVIVNTMQEPKPKKAADILVADPWNSDPLDLLWDASRDAALELMKERRQKESHSSSMASRSSSARKRHRSSSRSRNETNCKKGRPTPDRKHAVPDKETPSPRQQSSVPARKFNLNWHQDILEPLRPKWKPAARNAPATPQHKVQSVMQSTPDKPTLNKLASSGRGHGRVITEKLQDMAMGSVARSQYTGKENKEKPSPKKSGFLSREEVEAQKRREARKDWVCNHQEENIGERYFALKQQICWNPQEIRVLRFFELEGKESDLACQVIAITEAVEYNEFMTHPLPEIPTELLVPYSGPRQGRGQFPLAPTFEDTHSMDVRIQCQAQWTYLCAILQYFEDDMAAREGALYGRRVHRPSALVLYIMERVNPGLPEDFWVEWPSIVGSTPWLAARDHMTPEDKDRFNNEALSDLATDLEVAMEEVYE